MKSVFLQPSKWVIGIIVLFIVIFFASGCFFINHPPVITSLKTEHEIVLLSENCQIECIASDEDGDELSYEWSTSGGDIEGEGPAVIWIAPEDEGIYRIVVSVADGGSEIDTDSINIVTRTNHPPVITNLTAELDWILPLDSCQLKCKAEDIDGDELSYKWVSIGGDIAGTGTVATWTAPNTLGLYDIAVIVSDIHGAEDTRMLTMSVALKPAPIIEALIVTPMEPKYLKDDPVGYRILKGKSCEIECVVFPTDGDKVSYEWTSDGGSINGEGSIVTWTAPKEGGKVTVTVTVSANASDVASKSIVFDVKTCAACSFR